MDTRTFMEQIEAMAVAQTVLMEDEDRVYSETIAIMCDHLTDNQRGQVVRDLALWLKTGDN